LPEILYHIIFLRGVLIWAKEKICKLTKNVERWKGNKGKIDGEQLPDAILYSIG
jgi:hypothetical protein